MGSSINYFKVESERMGFTLSCEQVDLFEKYKHLIDEWNKKIDITAINDDKDIYNKHFLDSLALFRILEKPLNSSIVDIGSGGGFPGVPMKIWDSSIKLTMLDSLNKRIDFLKTVIKDLGLKNTTAIHGRAEDVFNESTMRETFDYAVSRAVAPLPTLLEYCLPSVKIGGSFIAMKGPDCNEEIENSRNALRILGGKIEKIDTFYWTEEKFLRTLIIVKKIDKCPTAYPRGKAKPRKRPL